MSTQEVVTTANSGVSTVKSYQRLDESTGEVSSKIKYLKGAPRQYRFDAKDGSFNINGEQKIGSSLSFQPLAWRIFEDDILQMGKKKWAELFFVDEKNCVSVILFHGFSVDNLMRLIEPLYYDDATLADVVLTVNTTKKENTKITPKGVYYIAEFTYKAAEAEKVKMLAEFRADHQIYRTETLTDVADVKVSFGYTNPNSFLGIEPGGELAQIHQ